MNKQRIVITITVCLSLTFALSAVVICAPA